MRSPKRSATTPPWKTIMVPPGTGVASRRGARNRRRRESGLARSSSATTSASTEKLSPWLVERQLQPLPARVNAGEEACKAAAPRAERCAGTIVPFGLVNTAHGLPARKDCSRMTCMSQTPPSGAGVISLAVASQVFSAFSSSEKPAKDPPTTCRKETSFCCAMTPAARKRQRRTARMRL